MLSRVLLLASAAAFAVSTDVFAADLGGPEPIAAASAPLPTRLLDPRPFGYEVRLGAFALAVGSIEKGTASVSLDLLLPQ